MFAILGDAANAYNAIGLYWVKVKIDSSVGLGKKGKQLKRIIKEAIEETK